MCEVYADILYLMFRLFRATEYAGHLHEHFLSPALVKNGAYLAPQVENKLLDDFS